MSELDDLRVRHTQLLDDFMAIRASEHKLKEQVAKLEGAISRVCHAFTDDCVRVTDPDRAHCTPENCLAMKAALGTPEASKHE